MVRNVLDLTKSMNIYIPSRDNNNTDKDITHGYGNRQSLLYGMIPVRGGVGSDFVQWGSLREQPYLVLQIVFR